MLKTLVKIQLISLYKSIFARLSNKSKDKQKKKNPIKLIVIGILFIYVIGAVMFSLGVTFHTIAKSFIETNQAWLYFSSVGIMCFGMSVILCIFMSNSLLFEAKDNELLLSLPIKPSDILGSRIISLAIVEYLTTFLILIPANIVYIYLAKPPLIFYVTSLYTFLLLPLLSVAVSCLFGYIISLVTSRMRNKSLFTVIFSLLLLTVYFWLYSSLMMNVGKIAESISAINVGIKKFLPPFYYYGTTLSPDNGSSILLSAILFAAWCIIPFALIYASLSHSFIRIATATHKAKKLVYKEKTSETQTAFIAMFKKEIKRFLGTPMYLLNCGIGFILMIAMGAGFAIKGPSLIGIMLNQESAPLVPMIVIVLSFLSIMSCTTSTSISLEGKNLWILRSSPVSVKDIFNSKIAVNLVFGISSLLIADVCIIVTLSPSIIDAIAIVLIPISLQIFTALVGIISNLNFPKLDFTNEALVVKQSASVIVSMLIGTAAAFALVMAYMFLLKDLPLIVTVVIVLIFFNVINLLFYSFINAKGVKMFNNL